MFAFGSNQIAIRSEEYSTRMIENNHQHTNQLVKVEAKMNIEKKISSF